MKTTPEEREEWRRLQGEGMTSAVGEYTPDEFYDLLDDVEELLRLQKESDTRFLEHMAEKEKGIQTLFVLLNALLLSNGPLGVDDAVLRSAKFGNSEIESWRDEGVRKTFYKAKTR